MKNLQNLKKSRKELLKDNKMLQKYCYNNNIDVNDVENNIIEVILELNMAYEKVKEEYNCYNDN